jgi:class 3 adenylate cyclase/tetratricopeptide (TPR) repeat protein
MAACPACGTDNPQGAKFCSECGSALGVSPTSSEEIRKTVTILFCDVTGSTELGEQLDPESLRKIMGRYFDEMRAVIERHGGTVEKFIGDAVMAVFGIPSLHEDDALRSVRAASEMRSALEDLNRGLERDFGVRLETRIGVNTGEVLVGTASSDFGRVTGDPVNTAARLETAARPGEILIGQDTHRLVQDAVQAEAVEPLTLKGKASPVPAYRVLDVLPGTAAPPRSLRSPIVGRGRELEDLQRAFDRAIQDRTCLLFTVLGAAGAGKSRLTEEFVARVEGSAHIVTGRCLPYGEGITYWPIAQAVRAVLDVHDFDRPEEVVSRLARTVDGDDHAEAIAGRLAQILGVAEGHAAPEETAWAIRRFLEILATEQPVIAIWEDVHWAEPAFLDAIDHIADRARDAPLLVICTARPEFLDTRPAWGGGKLRASALSLPPLDAVTSAELVANLLGGAGLPAEATERVNDAGGGNPLFVEQMVSMLIDDGLLVRDNGEWKPTGDLSTVAVPPSVAALLAARLDRLGDDERRAIECASVIGKEFYLGAVRDLLPEHLREDALALILSLVRKELVREERSTLPGELAFEFRHILIRDATYAAIPKERRAAQHERFAEWAVRVAGDRIEEQEEIVGYHLEQAFRYRQALGPLDDVARELSKRAAARLAAAGSRALVRPDYVAAANLLGRAAALIEREDPDRVAILTDLAWVLHEQGRLEDAQETISEAAHRAEGGDPTLRARVTITRWSMTPDSPGWHEHARADAEQAVTIFERAGDHPGLASAWNLIANTEWERGRAGAQLIAIDRALEHARLGGTVFEESGALYGTTAGLVRGPTPVSEGIARAESLVEEYGRNREVVAIMSHALAHLRARLGDFDAARDALKTYRAYLWDTGQVLPYWRSMEVAFDVEMLAGDAEEACRAAEEGWTQLTAMHDRWAYLAAFLAQGRYALGRLAEAEVAAAVAVGSADGIERALGLGVLAKLRAGGGAADQALESVAEAVSLVDRTDFLFDRGTVHLDRAETMRLLGREDEARLAADEAARLFDLKGDVISARRARTFLTDRGVALE